MKLINALVIGLSLSTALAIAGQRPEPPPGGPRGGPSIERLAQDLGLTEAQQAQVKKIFDAQRAKMDSERAQFEASGSRPSREEMQAKHEQMEAEIKQQLSAVLTAEQLAKFETLRQQHRPPGPPPGERGSSDSRE